MGNTTPSSSSNQYASGASQRTFSVKVLTGRETLVPSDLRLELTLLDRCGASIGPFALKKTLALLEVRIGGQEETHILDTTDFGGEIVGEGIIGVRLHARKGWRSLFSNLYLHGLHIRNTSIGFHAFVPICSWIAKGDNRVFFTGKSRLSRDCNAVELRLRAEDIAYHQQIYNSSTFVRTDGIPVGIAHRYQELPHDEQFDSIKGKMVLHNIIKKIADTGLAKLQGVFETWNSFEQMAETVYKPNGGFDRVAAADNWYWATDEAFGRQALTGVNPCMVKLCVDELPQMDITHEFLLEHVKYLRDKSIEEEIKKGSFAFLDYRPWLEDIVNDQISARATCQDSDDTFYMAAAVCLLYFDTDIGTLVPVAIQLKRGGEIYIPPDDSADLSARNKWLLAKMFVANADSQIHQIVTHLLRTHLVIEAFALATKRMLSSAHPLSKLLKPHLVNTMAINTLARQRLIGTIQELFSIGKYAIPLAAKAYENWNILDFSPTAILKNNGFGEECISPLVKPGIYPWREDALLLWQTLCDFVFEFVHIYYKGNDKLVQEDEELAAWHLEVTALHPEKPFAKIETESQLIELLSIIIWTASAQHASVNFNQFEVYGWQPSHPACLRTPIPEECDNNDFSVPSLLRALPSISNSVQAMALAKSLSEYAENEVYLGDANQDSMYHDSDAQIVLAQFSRNLEVVTSVIDKRNSTVRAEHPYLWMLPKKISNSIAV